MKRKGYKNTVFFSVSQMKYAELYFKQQEFIVRINPVDIVEVSLTPIQPRLFSEKFTLLMLSNAFFSQLQKECEQQQQQKFTEINTKITQQRSQKK